MSELDKEREMSYQYQQRSVLPYIGAILSIIALLMLAIGHFAGKTGAVNAQDQLRLIGAPEQLINQTVANFRVSTETFTSIESSETIKTVVVTLCDGTTWQTVNTDQATIVEYWLTQGLNPCPTPHANQ